MRIKTQVSERTCYRGNVITCSRQQCKNVTQNILRVHIIKACIYDVIWDIS